MIPIYCEINGHPLIKASISEALKKWRFQPVTVEARQVSITSIITFNFNDSIVITDNIASPNPDAHFDGRTTLFADILVNEKGDVACAKVSNGDQLLRDSVLNAAMKWKFRPMLKNRRRVSFLGRLLFTLKSD